MRRAWEPPANPAAGEDAFAAAQQQRRCAPGRDPYHGGLHGMDNSAQFRSSISAAQNGSPPGARLCGIRRS